MAVAAMAGSILAGWEVAAGRYRPRRWVRASFWAVAHTDSGRAGSPPGRGLAQPGRGGRGGRGNVIAGFLVRSPAGSPSCLVGWWAGVSAWAFAFWSLGLPASAC